MHPHQMEACKSVLNRLTVMDELRITSDTAEVNVSTVHNFLAEQSTWARGLPLGTFERAIENSLCFSGFIDSTQVAFARVVSDQATFANLVDVFVLPGYRGRGYGREIVQAVVSHPKLQGLRRFTLATADAHALYAKFGFTSPLRPNSLMERYVPGVYQHEQCR